jgi:hypothetical protein
MRHQFLAAAVLSVGAVALAGCRPADGEAVSVFDVSPDVRARQFGAEVRQFRVEIQPRSEGNGALGSVLSFVSEDGTARCAAGFVSSVGTRIYANQNELEFWCSPRNMPLILEWRSIDRPLPDYPTTTIGNVGGALFDYISNMFYDFESGRWVSLYPDDHAHLAGSRIYSLRREGDRTWLITHGLAGCHGLSVFSNLGYHGTFETNGQDFNAALIWRGSLVINAGGMTWSVDVPDAVEEVGCRRLEGWALIGEPNYVYAMFPVADWLLVGGGGWHRLEDPDYSCPTIYRITENGVTSIGMEPCKEREVTEIYGFAMYGDELVVGTYPDGRLYRMGLNRSVARRSPVPDMAERDADRPRYSESQALAVTAGHLLVGLYPWGEVAQVNDLGAESVYRLFHAPDRSAEREPFGSDARQAYCPDAELECIEGLSGEESWSQRVTTLAVFDGRVCAGTGNVFAQRHDPVTHSFISPELAANYGYVHCAAIPSQTLAQYQQIGRSEATFTVTRKYLVIHLGGRLAAARRHRLGPAALAAIAEAGGTIRIGVGPYGPAQATLNLKR